MCYIQHIKGCIITIMCIQYYSISFAYLWRYLFWIRTSEHLGDVSKQRQKKTLRLKRNGQHNKTKNIRYGWYAYCDKKNDNDFIKLWLIVLIKCHYIQSINFFIVSFINQLLNEWTPNMVRAWAVKIAHAKGVDFILGKTSAWCQYRKSHHAVCDVSV